MHGQNPKLNNSDPHYLLICLVRKQKSTCRRIAEQISFGIEHTTEDDAMLIGDEQKHF